jgi:hypothetical protein
MKSAFAMYIALRHEAANRPAVRCCSDDPTSEIDTRSHAFRRRVGKLRVALPASLWVFRESLRAPSGTVVQLVPHGSVSQADDEDGVLDERRLA